MKVLKRKILFSLASETDFMQNESGFDYKPYKYLYLRLINFSQSSVRDATLQLTESGYIDKIVRNAVPMFRLTSRGRQKLLSFFTLTWGQKRVWDNIWRLAIISQHKISKQGKRIKKRGRKTGNNREGSSDNTQILRILRRNLRSLGFKRLSRGIYITPLPVSGKIKDFYLENTKYSANITVIESRKLLIGDNQQLAKQVWQLDTLIIKYHQFITNISNLLKKLKQQKRLNQQEKLQFTLILEQYFSLLEADPGLPKKLLPPDWPYDKAQLEFYKLSQTVKKLEV
jgi:DNA-binding transcriptional regulator PaaX